MSIKRWSKLIVFILFFGIGTLCAQAAETTFVGEVNDTYQLVTDTQIYEIDENEVGDELVYEHIGERVAVTGTVQEQDDLKIITVKSFKIISE